MSNPRFPTTLLMHLDKADARRRWCVDYDPAVDLVSLIESEAISRYGRETGGPIISELWAQAVDMVNIVKGYRAWILAAQRGEDGPGVPFGFRDQGGTEAARWRRFLTTRTRHGIAPAWARAQYASTAERLAEHLDAIADEADALHGDELVAAWARELPGAAAAWARDRAPVWRAIAVVSREDYADAEREAELAGLT